MNDRNITRREMLASSLTAVAGAAALVALGPAAARASGAPIAITVYKDASCGCCKAWVTHLGTNGFAPVAKDRTDMEALKDSLGVPAALRSCHTAVIGKFVIEGHVPAADVKRMLAKPPKGVRGLAVAGMPAGSPGMEVPGGRTDRYDVMSFGANGKSRVFATHG